MMSGLENPTHMLLIFLVIQLVFGAKRLPEVGRGLGSGIRDFKNALTGDETHREASAKSTLSTSSSEPTK